ncbi:hypothetical protein AB1Y20_017739 [Prymnesium parvum]|uniref:PPM-type phosphatase domain-containing protein n=1 Tax=Prymnesium parvum TaxID=97485 RepID=A0AB34JPA3_PRYPA
MAAVLTVTADLWLRRSTYASTALPSAVRIPASVHHQSALVLLSTAMHGSWHSGAQDGCTATAVLIHDDASCEVLNVGVSRTAVQCSACEGVTAVVVFATRDHSAADAAEIDRITAAGGEVSCAHGSWLAALGGSEWRGARISNVLVVNW